MAASDLETRFAYLLKPIKDLAKNWDIDIASQLEDYLDEIDQITITFDGGATSMNFAEAALLIQGTACVYSKKVEYLYSMVYRVLDLLASKKKLLQAGSVGEDGKDKDAPETAVEAEDEFLTLDDVKEHHNIDVKNDGDGDHPAVAVIPRTPMALVKLDEAEKGDNPLKSRTGEVLANRYDFRMNLSHTHRSGSMLLDMSHLSLLEASLLSKPASTPFHPLPKSRLADEPPASIREDSVPLDEGLPADISIDDNEAPVDLDLPPLTPVKDVQEEPEQINKRQLRDRRKANITVLAKPLVDPWLCLDPHAAHLTTADKPFRKAKTFKIPLSLELETKKKRKRKKEEPETKKLQPISEFALKAYYSASSRLPSNPLKAPFPEFEPLYWKEYHRRQTKMRTVRKLLVEQGRLQELEEVEQEERADGADANAVPDLPAGVEDDEDGDFPLPELNEVPNMLPDGGDMLHLLDRTVPDVAPIVNSYEELVRQHVEGFMASAQQYAQVTELSKRVAEWEDKVIPRLKEEETHEPFDIHKSGSVIIDSVVSNSKAEGSFVPFKKVVEGKPTFEVCRLFLATLQLANNYNVQIDEPDGGVDTMKLKFLSTRRHHEDLKEYRAPSLQH